jgi:hypothetical protein
MPTTPPPAPAAPTIIARDTHLSVFWAAVTRATAYEVWYGTASDGAGRVLLGGDITGLTAEIAGLENNTPYYVWIRAKNPAGTSAYTPYAEGTPVLPTEAPGAPTVSESNTQLGLSWAEVPTATAYEIWYGTESNGSDRQKFGGDVTGPPAAITGLENGTQY